MDDLVQWLGEQLDEDERIARATDQTLGQRNLRWSAKPVDGAFFRVVAVGHYVVGTGEFSPEDAHHIAEHDPARVLREIDAKRQLIREILEYESQGDYDRGCAHSADYFASGLHSGHLPKDILSLRLIASGYSHRPSFREDWRP